MASVKDRIYRLVGAHIFTKDRDFGTVIEIIELDSGSDIRYVCVMDNGKNVDGFSILRMISSSNLIRKAQANENHVGSSIALTDGYEYAKRVVGTKRKHLATPFATANIETTAIIGDERIDITTHLSPQMSFPEDSNK